MNGRPRSFGPARFSLTRTLKYLRYRVLTSPKKSETAVHNCDPAFLSCWCLKTFSTRYQPYSLSFVRFTTFKASTSSEDEVSSFILKNTLVSNKTIIFGRFILSKVCQKLCTIIMIKRKSVLYYKKNAAKMT